MSWYLNTVKIQPPDGRDISEDVIEIFHKTMTGKNSRDIIGTSKKIIRGIWKTISAEELAKIYSAWQDQIDNGTTYTLQITDLSYSLDVIIKAEQQTYALPQNYNYSGIQFSFIEK